MEVGLAHGESLGDRQWVAGLDQDVEPPALHLRPFVDHGFEYLDRRLAHGHTRFVLLPTNPSGALLGELFVRNGPTNRGLRRPKAAGGEAPAGVPRALRARLRRPRGARPS